MRRPTHPLSNSSHPHHFESGMPVNLWGIDRRDVWRTCFCFHVRTATVVIGVVHLIIYILSLSFVAATFMYEPNQDGFPLVTIKPSDQLPTPQSKISSGNVYQEPRMQPYSQSELSGDLAPKGLENTRNAPFTFSGMDPRKPNSQAILLEVCYMLITLLMVYGAVRGKPSYLMPFFVLKVFKFCIYCLRMVGYFSYLPNVTNMIAQQPALPFREEFLRMDPQLLSLLALIFIVGNIAIRAYIIGVIWNCYKYLMLRNTVIRGVIAYRQDDPMHMLGIQQNLLPDLPDYETAVNDPRYAKKPPLDPSSTSMGSAGTGNGAHSDNSNMVFTSAHSSTIGLPPPPPYSAVAAAGSVTVIGNTMPIPDVVSSPPIPSQLQQQAVQSPVAAAPAPQIEQQEQISSTHLNGSEQGTHISDTVVIETCPPAHTTTTTAVISIDHH